MGLVPVYVIEKIERVRRELKSLKRFSLAGELSLQGTRHVRHSSHQDPLNPSGADVSLRVRRPCRLDRASGQRCNLGHDFKLLHRKVPDGGEPF